MVQQEYRAMTADEVDAGAAKRNVRLVGYHDLNGCGDGFRIDKKGDYLFVAHLNRKAFSVLNVANPARRHEVGRGWVPGTWGAGGEQLSAPPGDEWMVHGPVVEGDRAYVGLWDAGWAILDISDKSQPRTISQLNWRPPYGG